jgi:hypothetical protein
VILTASAEACPEGWSAGGQVVLITSPEYPAGEGQSRTSIGLFTDATVGFENVNFYLCVKSAE